MFTNSETLRSDRLVQRYFKMLIVDLIDQDYPGDTTLAHNAEYYLSRVPCVGEEIFIKGDNFNYTVRVTRVQHIPHVDPSVASAIVYVTDR